jgi:hypothetical protein
LTTRLNNTSLYSPKYDISVLNLGVGGERTTAALSRIDRTSWTCPCKTKSPACPVNSLKYWYCNGTLKANDLFVLLEGTNDISGEIGVETIAYNLGQLGNKAEALGLDVLIMTLAPRHEDACVDAGNELAEELNGEIAALASSEDWPLIDVYSRLSVFANLFDNHYQTWDPMKCAVPAPNCSVTPCDPVGHPKDTGFTKMTWEAGVEQYPRTIEYGVRGALPPRLTLTPPTPPSTQGSSLAFSVALPDLATFGQTVELTWDFGDGTVQTATSSISPVARSHAYSSSGPFTVTVTAEHANGGTRAVSVGIDVAASAGTIFVNGFDVGNSSAWQ